MKCERAIPLTYIPFCKYNDSTRLQMACSHIRQAIPLTKPEMPLIKSSMATVPFLYPFVIRAPYRCKCIDIIDNKIVIMRLSDKYVDVIDLVTYMFENIYQPYFIAALPGLEYEEGDKLAVATTVTDDGFVMTGTNLLCGIDIYFGYNYNDAIVISDKAAAKLTSTHYHNFQFNLYNDQILVPIDPNPTLYDLPKYVPFVGDRIKAKDPIISISTNFLDKPKHKTFDRDITVLSSNIYTTSKSKDILKHYPELEKFVNIYRKKKYYELKNAIDQEGTDNLSVQAQRLLKELSLPKVGGEIEAHMFINMIGYYEDKAQLGDKLTNRHGNKGCIAKIVPHYKMPYIPKYNRRLDIVLNPLGIISRMNIGQLFELHLGKVILDLEHNRHDLTSEQIETVEKITKQKIGPIIKSDTPLINNLSLYDNVTWDDIKQLLNVLNSKTKEEVVFAPNDTRITSIGYMYIQKLYHRAANKISARAIGKYSRRTLQPIHSSVARAGQRIGEMETWAIAAYDTIDLLKTMMSALSDNRKAKVDLLSKLIGLDIPVSDVSDKCEASNLLMAYFKVIGLDLTVEEE